jgi:hypothetical protein
MDLEFLSNSCLLPTEKRDADNFGVVSDAYARPPGAGAG